MHRRKLGRINHHSSIVTLGAAGLGRADLPQAVVDQAVEQALAAGVNHLDIAPTYGNAMEHMAPWMPRLLDEGWFIGAKTRGRTREEAWENIRSCQQRLGVKTFDLFQLHSVVDFDDLDQVTQPGGGLEALIEMRQQGLTPLHRHHRPRPPPPPPSSWKPSTDSTSTPLCSPSPPPSTSTPTIAATPGPLLDACQQRNVGVQTIKMLARGGWGDGPQELSCWYDPHREQPQIDQGPLVGPSQPVHTAPSTGETTLLPRIFSAAKRFRPLDAAGQTAALAAQHPPRPEPASPSQPQPSSSASQSRRGTPCGYPWAGCAAVLKARPPLSA